MAELNKSLDEKSIINLFSVREKELIVAYREIRNMRKVESITEIYRILKSEFGFAQDEVQLCFEKMKSANPQDLKMATESFILPTKNIENKQIINSQNIKEAAFKDEEIIFTEEEKRIISLYNNLKNTRPDLCFNGSFDGIIIKIEDEYSYKEKTIRETIVKFEKYLKCGKSDNVENLNISVIHCPVCGKKNVNYAELENGFKGLWCLDCNKSLQSMGFTIGHPQTVKEQTNVAEKPAEQKNSIPGWVIFILIYGVGNLILYNTTGLFLFPIPRK